MKSTAFIKAAEYPLAYIPYKSLLVMQFTAALLLLTCLQVSAAGILYGQKKITINEENVSLVKVFRDIRKQTGYNFVYVKEDIQAAKPVTLHIEDGDIEHVLNQCFADQPLTFLIRNNIIIVSSLLSSANTSAELPIITVKGQVTDSATGKPLEGVSIQVRGKAIGAISDENGQFTIVAPDDAVLLASYLGYNRKEIAVEGRMEIHISLGAVTTGLDQVVVVGYGIQKKITVTGAVTTVSGKELLKSPVPNLSAALVGRTPGVIALQSSGLPGRDDAILRIRGIGTLSNASASPLVLVDGIERSFNQLDPNEVESISVLKDASSTAVYGIRGANGVIIVTTKQGAEGPAKINYTGNYAVQTPTRLPKFLDGYNYAEMYNEALRNDNPLTTLTFTDDELQKFKDQSDPLFYPNTDWLKLLLRKSTPQSQQNINISGGTKVARYFVSLGFLNQDGLFKEFQTRSGTSNNSTYKRYNFRSNISINVTSTTQVNFELGGYSGVRHSSQGTEANNLTIFHRILNSAPTATIGIWDDKVITLDRSGNRNMIADALANGFYDGMQNSLSFNLGINQELDMITKGLSVRGKIAYDNTYLRARVFGRNVATYTPVRVMIDGVDSTVLRRNGEGADVIGDPTTTFTRSLQFYTDFAMEYNNSFGNHNVGALILYNQKKRWYHDKSYPGIPLGYQDWVGRVTYNYALRYLLEFNLGRNGSENFPKDHRFGWFPAISAGWIATEEPFVKNAIDKSWLSYLKLRASYGEVGNDQLGAARFLYFPGEYISGGYGYFGEDPVQYISFLEGKLGNPDVTWEKAKKLDVAVDAKLFNDQLSITFDYFTENRSNILTSLKTVPDYVAVSLQDAYNIGKVRNRGFELEAGWTSKVNDFQYWVNGNFSFARNKIIYMDEPLSQTYPNLNRTGHRVGEQFGYVFDGFFNTSEEIATAPLYFGKQPSLGDTKYKDITGDGVIDQNDQEAIGNPSFPEVTYGFSLGFSFKGFDFSALFQGATNYDVAVRDVMYQPFAAFGSAIDIIKGRWHADSPDDNAKANFPKLSVNYSIPQNYYLSTLNMKDASYLRLKNMELGYTFTKEWLARLRVSSLRVFVSGQNLFTWDKLKIVDPESDPSYDLEYPQLKIYNVGCSLQF